LTTLLLVDVFRDRVAGSRDCYSIFLPWRCLHFHLAAAVCFLLMGVYDGDSMSHDARSMATAQVQISRKELVTAPRVPCVSCHEDGSFLVVMHATVSFLL
jgi:hypothetical protein